MASFSEPQGVVVLRETRERKRKRLRREVQRVGWLRFLDVFVFRAYYQFFVAAKDRVWEQQQVAALCAKYPRPRVSELITTSPNTGEAERFIRDAKPELVIARCKTLIAQRIFTIPTVGTFVMHPGICPEYRNAHGCFWAVANADVERFSG